MPIRRIWRNVNVESGIQLTYIVTIHLYLKFKLKCIPTVFREQKVYFLWMKTKKVKNKQEIFGSDSFKDIGSV